MRRTLLHLKRKFIRDESGAVSIYLIIVVLLLFIFNAVFIDFARIMVAEHQTEVAAKKSLRSTFSAYDTELQKMGMYAFHEESVSEEDIFEEVFKSNLNAEGDYFHFIDNQLEEYTLESDPDRTLRNVDVFKHQILEDMKYTAPVEYGKLITEQLNPVACAMEKTSEFVNIASEVDPEFTKRSTAINDLKEELRKANEALFRIKDKVNGNKRSYPSASDLQDILVNFDDYEDDTEGEDRPDFESNSKSTVNTIEKQLNIATKSLKKAQDDLEEVIKLNEKIEKEIDGFKEKNDAKYERMRSKCASADTQGMQEASNSVDQYVIKKAPLTTLEGKIKDAHQYIGDKTSSSALDRIRHLEDVMKEAFQSESKPPNLASLIKSIRDPYGKWRKTVNTINQDFTTYIPKEYFTENDIAAGKKEKAKDKFKLAKDIFEQGKATYKDKGEYDELQTLLGNYTGSNAISVDEMTSAEGTSKAAVNQMDDLFGNLSEILTGVRDEAYINEYIMTRFKSVQNPSELSSCGNQTPMYKCLPEAYLYSNREVEYIIYGSHQPGINYGYALTELFLTRLALNLAGEFSNNETVKLIPHPWAKFWYALSVALEKTLDNMEVLTSGGEVSFVDLNGYKPDYSMLTDYKFYLRMFLFLHPEGKKIARIQASVDKSTNSDMSKLPTYIKANVESSVDLWFLPGITKLLGRANIVNGDVSNGRYYIETKIVYSY